MQTSDEHPFGILPDDPDGEHEKRVCEMIHKSALSFALFERQWKRKQREKKRQEQQPEP